MGFLTRYDRELREPVFLPGESHGQRSLANYSPCGHKELAMTEQLSVQANGQCGDAGQPCGYCFEDA